MELFAGEELGRNLFIRVLAIVHNVKIGSSVCILCCIDVIKDCVKAESVEERNKNIFIAVVALHVETADKELEADICGDHCKNRSKR